AARRPARVTTPLPRAAVAQSWVRACLAARALSILAVALALALFSAGLMRRRWKAEKRKEQRKDAVAADRAALDKAGLRAARKRKMTEQHAAQHAKRAHLEAPHARLLALHPEDVASHAPGHGVGAPVAREVDA